MDLLFAKLDQLIGRIVTLETNLVAATNAAPAQIATNVVTGMEKAGK